MKKQLFFIFLVCIFVSCSKDNKSPTTVKTNTGKTYTVKFNINATGTSTLHTNGLQRNTAAASVPVSDFANVLYYWVYDSSGKLITQLTQDSSSTNFGQITDTYAAGTYHIVLLAQNKTNNGAPAPPAAFSTGYCVLNGDDSFFDSFSLQVTNSSVNQDITLQRVVGQLQVVITDSIPHAATKIEVQIWPYQDLKISNGTPVTENDAFYDNVTLPDSVKGKKNFTITTYVANAPATPFTVNITAYNSANTAIAKASVDSVTTQANTRTILSGALFPHEANLGFTISWDDTWNSDTTTIPFRQVLIPINKHN